MTPFREEDFSFRPARPEEADEVFRLWHSLVGTPFCAWNESYPARAMADEDIALGALYCLCRENEIIGVGTIRRWEEHDSVASWKSRRPCDLMRIGIKRSVQGRGAAGILLRRLLGAARDQGHDGMRILVCRDNLPAIRLYTRAGAVARGEAFAYDIHWLCLEIV